MPAIPPCLQTHTPCHPPHPIMHHHHPAITRPLLFLPGCLLQYAMVSWCDDTVLGDQKWFQDTFVMPIQEGESWVWSWLGRGGGG